MILHIGNQTLEEIAITATLLGVVPVWLDRTTIVMFAKMMETR